MWGWSYYDSDYGIIIPGDHVPPWGTEVTAVVISDGVTSIGSCAFYYCSYLTSITIPAGVTYIGHDAFYGCSSLTSITIPNGVTSIDYDAFYGCSGLTSITIPESVTSLALMYTFAGCSSLTSIDVNENNGYYASVDGALYDKTLQTLLSVPAGKQAFDVPNGVTGISDFAFYSCSRLTSITIPSSVTRIESSTFYGCSSLARITIPASVTYIDDFDTFENCSYNLTFLCVKGSYAERYANSHNIPVSYIQ